MLHQTTGGMGLTLRPWRDASDWAVMAEISNSTRDADGRDTFATAEGLEADIAGWPGSDAARVTRIAEMDGVPVGWVDAQAYRGGDGGLLLGVRLRLRPAWRSARAGALLLAEAEARAVADREARFAHDTGPACFQAWVLDTDQHLVGLLERAGYAAVRRGHEMRLSLQAPLASAALPDGFEFRPVTLELARHVLTAFDEAMRDAWEYPDLTEDDLLATLDIPALGQLANWVVAWEGDEPVSGSLGYILEDENEALGRQRGYVERIWTRRPWRGRGLASAVIARALAHYRDAGMTEAQLSVDTENASGALGLYERMGFRRVGGMTIYRRPMA